MSTTRTHFTFRVDTWTPDGESIVEHIADVEDLTVALIRPPANAGRHAHHFAAGRARTIEDSPRGDRAWGAGARILLTLC